MKTKENIDTDNYYYYQAFTDNFELQKGVVFAKNTKEATDKVWKMMIDKEMTRGLDIHLYHKNYKRDSRKMVEAGNYLE